MTVIDIRTSPGYKPNVLLLDDQSTVLSIHEALLKHIDSKLHTVVTTSPIEALDFIQKKPVDLFITDLKMPHVDGFELIKRAKALSSNQNMKVLVITALKGKSVGKNVSIAGGIGCLQKPVQREALADILRREIYPPDVSQ